MFSRVYEHASTIRKLYKLRRHVPDVFSSVRTRRYHSQNEKIRSAQMCFFVFTRVGTLLFSRLHGRVSTIRKTTELRTGRVGMVSDVSAGIRTPICHL